MKSFFLVVERMTGWQKLNVWIRKSAKQNFKFKRFEYFLDQNSIKYCVFTYLWTCHDFNGMTKSESKHPNEFSQKHKLLCEILTCLICTLKNSKFQHSRRSHTFSNDNFIWLIFQFDLFPLWRRLFPEVPVPVLPFKSSSSSSRSSLKVS